MVSQVVKRHVEEELAKLTQKLSEEYAKKTELAAYTTKVDFNSAHTLLESEYGELEAWRKEIADPKLKEIQSKIDNIELNYVQAVALQEYAKTADLPSAEVGPRPPGLDRDEFQVKLDVLTAQVKEDEYADREREIGECVDTFRPL